MSNFNLKIKVRKLSKNLFHVVSYGGFSIGVYTDIEENKDKDISFDVHFHMPDGKPIYLYYFCSEPELVATQRLAV
jgi:hypothetical protein